ncbi:MAG TPA: hypothetical protein GX505_00025 [Clostridiales bacterium]|nr:hypothetical protein [Clostridiales bacterium]
MILHTIVDPEFIWSAEPVDTDTKEINYKGVQVEVRRIDENKYVIDRILSTELKNYLDPELQPGCIIEYTLRSQG